MVHSLSRKLAFLELLACRMSMIFFLFTKLATELNFLSFFGPRHSRTAPSLTSSSFQPS